MDDNDNSFEIDEGRWLRLQIGLLRFGHQKTDKVSIRFRVALGYQLRDHRMLHSFYFMIVNFQN